MEVSLALVLVSPEIAAVAVARLATVAVLFISVGTIMGAFLYARWGRDLGDRVRHVSPRLLAAAAVWFVAAGVLLLTGTT